jgi:hypothetical protein
MKVLFSNFYNEKPMTVEKAMGRSIWNALSTAELRWKGTLAPCAPSRLSALHEATA